MTALVLSLTNAGLAAVQGASGADPVVIAELGLTATPFDVAPTLTALPGEFKRIAAVSGAAASANITHMTAYDTSADVWNATGLGLWLADGTLFAVYSAGSTIINKAQVAFAMISFDIAWQADLAATIAFGDPVFTNPPATEDARGLVQLATLAEAQAGTDLLRALTPGRAKAAVLSWLLGLDGSGSGLDADLLDGQHGAWYADIAARLGYTPLNAAAYNAADVLAKLITVDGSGSGIDADLWRGKSPAQFLADNFPSGSNANGYWRKEPDGAGGFFIRQWGTATTGYGYGVGNDGWSGTLNLPIDFTDIESVQARAWPKTLNTSGLDSDAVVAELLTTSTYRVGSEDIVRDVYWEFFGR